MPDFAIVAGHIVDYDLVVIGHLRWNRYLGESEANSPRETIRHPKRIADLIIPGHDNIILNA